MKWALRGMTKAAAIDLVPRKIRVNSVHPGPIDTDMLNVRTPEQNARRLKLVPMKRMCTAEEVASFVLFLLSDESGYVTGAEVAIDGGAALWRDLTIGRREHRGSERARHHGLTHRGSALWFTTPSRYYRVARERTTGCHCVV
jgi:hypothetical protein